jgi:hypothetical protein
MATDLLKSSAGTRSNGGHTSWTLRIAVRDLDGPDHVQVYIDLDRFAPLLGLVLGAEVKLLQLKVSVSEKGNIYCSAKEWCTGVVVVKLPIPAVAHLNHGDGGGGSQSKRQFGSAVGMCESDGIATGGAAVRGVRPLAPASMIMAANRRYLSYYITGRLDLTVSRLYCRVLDVKSVEIWFQCTNDGCRGLVQAKVCPQRCFAKWHQCFVKAKFIVDDGTAEAMAFIDTSHGNAGGGSGVKTVASGLELISQLLRLTASEATALCEAARRQTAGKLSLEDCDELRYYATRPRAFRQLSLTFRCSQCFFGGVSAPPCTNASYSLRRRVTRSCARCDCKPYLYMSRLITNDSLL